MKLPDVTKWKEMLPCRVDMERLLIVGAAALVHFIGIDDDDAGDQHGYRQKKTGKFSRHRKTFLVKSNLDEGIIPHVYQKSYTKMTK